ncbi:LOW QUALITY PROTEIN: hypothetical protein Cgig2_032554 [Carnegiea gigantea]|uniref:Uncharacterized protein n=1 Tax=Carnegiea gigantea TaxID=171969 RepID=A0A9Q1QQZ6_9CARY|nr:LOW QUALITY PROTEIN: hypothetical protein Cgig2_032554 [Carnegiea gigantea]
MSFTYLCFVLLVLFIQEPFSFVFVNGSSKVHIVYMGETKHDNPQQVQDSHHEILADLLGSKEAAKLSLLYSYKHGFSGFAAILTKSQADLMRDFPGVVGVVQNRVLRVQTTRSWDFLHVKPQIAKGILSKAHLGAGSIIGVIDSGIWPESESFKDDGMEDIPSRWRGICQGGEQFNNSNFNKLSSFLPGSFQTLTKYCHRKIIGARWYVKGYEAELGSLNRSAGPEFLSPRDAVGHGTHTASTAAGALVEDANFAMLGKGLARGGAPRAWLAVYKVCWVNGACSSADILAAFDDAISDGVDVISLSLGSPPPLHTYVKDPVAIGSFHAVAKGITVVCAAGNSGPRPQTVTGIAPWLVTVAASTIDRAFPTAITLGNNKTVWGQSLVVGKDMNRFHSLAFGGYMGHSDGSMNCAPGSLDASLARGKVVLCFQSKTQRAWNVAVETVKKAKGLGLIFAQSPNKDVSFTSSFPVVLVDYTIGTYVLSYIDSASIEPVVKFRPTETVVARQISPEVAFFSSRGPSSLSPHVLKVPFASLLHSSYKNGIESGTSSACPHVSGILALLKSIHPTWSPAALKSAIVTTASIKDEYGQHIVAEGLPHKEADPFDYVGGHIEPNKAFDPGLIYDMKTSDYIHFLCLSGYQNSAIHLMTRAKVHCRKEKESILDLNLPSISVPELKKTLTVRRAVTNVGPAISVYKARVEPPPGVSVKIEPSVLCFNSTANKHKFKVTFTPQLRGRYSFGYLYWEDGLHVVQTALVVRTVIGSYYSET